MQLCVRVSQFKGENGNIFLDTSDGIRFQKEHFITTNRPARDGEAEIDKYIDREREKERERGEREGDKDGQRICIVSMVPSALTHDVGLSHNNRDISTGARKDGEA